MPKTSLQSKNGRAQSTARKPHGPWKVQPRAERSGSSPPHAHLKAQSSYRYCASNVTIVDSAASRVVALQGTAGQGQAGRCGSGPGGALGAAWRCSSCPALSQLGNAAFLVSTPGSDAPLLVQLLNCSIKGVHFKEVVIGIIATAAPLPPAAAAAAAVAAPRVVYRAANRVGITHIRPSRG